MITRLDRHLAEWLGAWPPSAPLSVVGSARRSSPGWDGNVHPAIGIGSPAGAVLSVAPPYAGEVAARAAEGLTVLGPQVPKLVGFGERGWFTAVFRWSTAPAALADAGVWKEAADPSVPEWLRPFGGQVLVAEDPDSGAHLAGVGIKRHDAYGHELSVVTAEAARGRGLARRLVAQAARRVLDEGAVPTYMHATSNAASAAVAEAAGFTDRGWTAFGVTERPRLP
ncbi:GNAT family N-acetyltransferase [Nonomuraea africana]|uniref:GNAT superfamily N-acetyltransferase n=1 Tax=Nonomuraea africana TaxID=46171 RepID=A0ABR9KDC5_9ACTN|nr:GNAT family N-acetyltransferase [Nonomuraea africana]MBE1559557.1 GNAT superfamily N-acetyltransferase [Nonomuraea africana]